MNHPDQMPPSDADLFTEDTVGITANAEEDIPPQPYSEETRYDVIRSLAYGQTAEEIIACNDLLTTEAIATITAQYAAELAEESAYRTRMEE